MYDFDQAVYNYCNEAHEIEMQLLQKLDWKTLLMSTPTCMLRLAQSLSMTVVYDDVLLDASSSTNDIQYFSQPQSLFTYIRQLSHAVSKTLTNAESKLLDISLVAGVIPTYTRNMYEALKLFPPEVMKSMTISQAKLVQQEVKKCHEWAEDILNQFERAIDLLMSLITCCKQLEITIQSTFGDTDFNMIENITEELNGMYNPLVCVRSQWENIAYYFQVISRTMAHASDVVKGKCDTDEMSSRYQGLSDCVYAHGLTNYIKTTSSICLLVSKKYYSNDLASLMLITQMSPEEAQQEVGRRQQNFEQITSDVQHLLVAKYDQIQKLLRSHSLRANTTI